MKPLDPPSDVVQVAHCDSPTEAHLIRGVLASAGIDARVADAHMIQANPWLSQAVGGVRVLVPGVDAAAAAEVLQAYRQGHLELEPAAAPPTPAARPRPPGPLFHPDRAALLSLVLTPAFGAALQFANARRDGASRAGAAGAWLLAMTLCSAAAVWVMQRMNPGPMVVFRSSLVLWFITALWYFVHGQRQSRHYLTHFGSGCPRRPLAGPALVATALGLAIGIWLN